MTTPNKPETSVSSPERELTVREALEEAVKWHSDLYRNGGIEGGYSPLLARWNAALKTPSSLSTEPEAEMTQPSDNSSTEISSEAEKEDACGLSIPSCKCVADPAATNEAMAESPKAEAPQATEDNAINGHSPKVLEDLKMLVGEILDRIDMAPNDDPLPYVREYVDGIRKRLAKSSPIEAPRVEGELPPPVDFLDYDYKSPLSEYEIQFAKNAWTSYDDSGEQECGPDTHEERVLIEFARKALLASQSEVERLKERLASRFDQVAELAGRAMLAENRLEYAGSVLIWFLLASALYLSVIVGLSRFGPDSFVGLPKQSVGFRKTRTNVNFGWSKGESKPQLVAFTCEAIVPDNACNIDYKQTGIWISVLIAGYFKAVFVDKVNGESFRFFHFRIENFQASHTFPFFSRRVTAGRSGEYGSITRNIPRRSCSSVGDADRNVPSSAISQKIDRLKIGLYRNIWTLLPNKQINILLRNYNAGTCGTSSAKCSLSVFMSNLETNQHHSRLISVNDYLPDNRTELEKSAYSDNECQPDIPSIDAFLFCYSLGFFGGFFIAVYGACIYHQRRRLGASLIGLGGLCGAIATAYFIFGLSGGGECISIKQHDCQQQGQTLQHDGENVSQKFVDAACPLMGGLAAWSLQENTLFGIEPFSYLNWPVFPSPYGGFLIPIYHPLDGLWHLSLERRRP